MRPRTQPLSHRKARDRSAVLPVLGVLLLMPPLARVFRVEGTLGGIPVPILCVFAVWAALIASAVALSRPLSAPDAPAEDERGDARLGAARDALD